MQTRTVTYYSDGDVVVADLHLPDDFDEEHQYPVILQCQGFTGIRRMIQPVFANYFVNAGFITLAIDYRGWGDSDSRLVLRGTMPELDASHEAEARVLAVREVVDLDPGPGSLVEAGTDITIYSRFLGGGD